jgi:methenyltetrahydrofolate cyclohydrolase
MYRNGTIKAYLSDAAAKKSAPGGGSISAMAGALAATMGEMAANFTVGRKKYASVEVAVAKLLKELQTHHTNLLRLVDDDVEAYRGVSHAMRMPRSTDVQKSQRRQAMESALHGAMQPPLQIAELCEKIGGIAVRLVNSANPNLITDVCVCAILAEAACSSAIVNVFINLKYMKNSKMTARVHAKLEDLQKRADGHRKRVERAVERHLGL